jgi:AmiR/NasT family two-component response regulator
VKSKNKTNRKFTYAPLGASVTSPARFTQKPAKFHTLTLKTAAHNIQSFGNLAEIHLRGMESLISQAPAKYFMSTVVLVIPERFRSVREPILHDSAEELIKVSLPEVDTVIRALRHQALAFLRRRLADWIVLSEQFDEIEITRFIDSSKRIQGAEGVPILLLTQDDKNNRDLITSAMVVGVHGFIAPPLSKERIAESFRIAASVKKQGSAARLKTVASLLVTDAFTKLSNDPKQLELLARIESARQQFRDMTGQSITAKVVTNLQPLMPRERLQGFRGMASRIRRRILEHMAADASGK